MNNYILNRFFNDLKNEKYAYKVRRLSSGASIDLTVQKTLGSSKELFKMRLDFRNFHRIITKTMQELIETISDEIETVFTSKTQVINFLQSMESNWLYNLKEGMLAIEEEFRKLRDKYGSLENNFGNSDEDFGDPSEVVSGSESLGSSDPFSANLLQSMLAHLDETVEGLEVGADNSAVVNDVGEIKVKDSPDSDLLKAPTIIHYQPALVASRSRLSLKRTTVSEYGDQPVENFASLLELSTDGNDVNVLNGIPENDSTSSDTSVLSSLHISSDASVIIPQASVIKMTYEDNLKNKHTLSKHYIPTDECYVRISKEERRLVDTFKRKAPESSEESNGADSTSGSEIIFRKVTSIKRRRIMSSSSSSSSSDYSSPASAATADNSDAISVQSAISREMSDVSVSSNSATSKSVTSEESILNEVSDTESTSSDDSSVSKAKKRDGKKKLEGAEGESPKMTMLPDSGAESIPASNSDDDWRKDCLLNRLNIKEDVEASTSTANNDAKEEIAGETSEVKKEEVGSVSSTTTTVKLRLKKPVRENDDASSDDDDVVMWPVFKSPKRKKADDRISDGSDVEFISSTPQQTSDNPFKKGRRNIKEILSEEDLNVDTRKAHEAEKQRLERLEARQHSQAFQASQTSLESADSDFVLDANDKHPIVVHKALADFALPHQRKGVQFLWDNCYESLERIQSGDLGSGCILAHCMGLGKTFQVVALVHTLFKHPQTKTRKVLILAPLSVVPNWTKEFRKANKLVANLKYQVSTFTNQKSLELWDARGGVYILGYSAFLAIIKKGVTKTNACLMEPGADLIICDEGHLLKSGSTLKTKVISKVKTKRRIILTGTPMQNNLDEYYFMVEFVKPSFLGTPKEYHNRFVNPIHNGQFEDSSYTDIQVMKKRSHVLHKITRSFIQRFEESELSQHLPTKYDYGLKLELNESQKKLLKSFMDICNHKNLFENVTIIRDVITHPHLLQMRLDNANKKIKKDAKEDSIQDLLDQLNGKNPDWWKDDIPADSATNIMYGTKIILMLSIVQKTKARREKILIFSASLLELDLIEKFLQQSDANWLRGKSYYRIDGSVVADKREKYCLDFNTPSSPIRLMLLTPKVGGLGLNLFAANRAILMDISWNPANDTQSVFRIYRLGQQKTCYIYRFIAMGTMEEVIYERSITKQAISRRVVDEQQIMRHFASSDLESLYRYKMVCGATRPTPKLPQDDLLASLLQEHRYIYSYHDHKEMLQNRPDEELDDNEMKLAWEEYENEKNAPIWQPQPEPLPGPSGNHQLPQSSYIMPPLQPLRSSTNITPKAGINGRLIKERNKFTHATTPNAPRRPSVNPATPSSSKCNLDGKLILFESPAAKNGMIRATFDGDGNPTNPIDRDSLTVPQLNTALTLRHLPASEMRAKIHMITRAGVLKELDASATSGNNPQSSTLQIRDQINLADDD